ncbi:SAC3/GANP/Nin1/mts3/eIF-3 p25 family-domain-containing protein [Scenedesmus sp. NREL 46B-D3]|nr:SAC3/GANP/Nin1/mts3/eIF-3 p25 family-domain-containing protein [Scenedesmus sp. NREL 46B-D3]
MSQPYAAQGYGSYPYSYGAPQGYGYPPAAPGQFAYDYSSYYQQQPPGYDANYSAWYAQQQQASASTTTASAGVAPPLPKEPPPPLPPGDEPPPAPAAPPADAAGATAPAAAAPAQQAPPTPTSTASSAAASASQQQQHASYSQSGQYNAYAQQYPGGYGGYGSSYGAAHPSYASYYPNAGQFGPPSASTNPYAPQVNQATAGTGSANVRPPSVPPAGAGAPSLAAAQSASNDYSRMPPPSSLTAGVAVAGSKAAPSGYGSYAGAPAVAAAGSGSNLTPIGGGGAGGSSAPPTALDAMKAAAASVASRLTASQPLSGKPAYLQAAAVTAAPQLQQQQQHGAPELPNSLQQYVARALSLLGKTNETRLELRTVLRDVIAKTKKDGTMWSTDWDREPLPVLASAAQQHSNSSGSGDDGEEEWYGSYQPRKRVEPGSASKKQQKQQQGKQKQQGKKGKHNKQRWGEDESWDPAEQAKHAARSARFAGQQQRSSTLAAYGWDEGGDPDDAAAAGEFIVGTSTALEKGYFRLTRAPLPEEVRPQPVLAAALSRLLRMVAAHEDKYLYYNDQFKAMRQDLTVQGIKNEFTVQVYEAHARAALEYGDNAEYNQCQTQLAILYAAGLPGSHAEFGSYRLLYQSVHAAAGEGRRLLGTLRQLLGNKVGTVADSPELQHAMQVRQALAGSNVSRFFKLYACAPRLSRCLMDVAVKQLRWRALNTLVRAHKPGVVPLPFLARALGFVLPPEEQPQQPQQQQDAGGSGSGVFRMTRQLAALTVDGAGQLLPGCSERSCTGENAPLQDLAGALVACLEWCKRHGAVFDSAADLSASCLLTKECWQKLFIPADTTKVAHGDVNLDIRDFLAL